MAYRLLREFRQASTRLDTPPLSIRHHPESAIALARYGRRHITSFLGCGALGSSQGQRRSASRAQRLTMRSYALARSAPSAGEGGHAASAHPAKASDTQNRRKRIPPPFSAVAEHM